MENLNDNLKESLSQREAEVDAFKSENEHLKKQKDALMRAFNEDTDLSSGVLFPDHLSSTSAWILVMDRKFGFGIRPSFDEMSGFGLNKGLGWPESKPEWLQPIVYHLFGFVQNRTSFAGDQTQLRANSGFGFWQSVHFIGFGC